MKRGGLRDQTRLQEAGKKHKTKRTTRGASAQCKIPAIEGDRSRTSQKKCERPTGTTKTVDRRTRWTGRSEASCDGLKAPRIQVHMGRSATVKGKSSLRAKRRGRKTRRSRMKVRIIQ
jgi:hypothetical protein